MGESVSAKRPPLRVLLVDDHEVVRDGIKALLQATKDIVVTGEAGTVREAVDEADRTRPDVVVMDVRLAGGSGIEATREIRAEHPKTEVVMLTSFADDEALFASIMAGAAGYVLKQVKGAVPPRDRRPRRPSRRSPIRSSSPPRHRPGSARRCGLASTQPRRRGA